MHTKAYVKLVPQMTTYYPTLAKEQQLLASRDKGTPLPPHHQQPPLSSTYGHQLSAQRPRVNQQGTGSRAHDHRRLPNALTSNDVGNVTGSHGARTHYQMLAMHRCPPACITAAPTQVHKPSAPTHPGCPMSPARVALRPTPIHQCTQLQPCHAPDRAVSL